MDSQGGQHGLSWSKIGTLGDLRKAKLPVITCQP